MTLGFIDLGKKWGIKVVYSVADQGIMSGANFVIYLLLARWLPPDEYGAFIVAFTTFVFFSEFHYALILEPMAVLGPSHYREFIPSYLRSLLILHASLTGILSMLTGFSALFFAYGFFTKALWGLTLAMPFILLFGLFRRTFYLKSRSDLATISSLAYAVIVVFLVWGFFHLKLLSVTTAFVGMALAGIISCIFSFKNFHFRSLDRTHKPSFASALAVTKDHWGYGKWLAAAAFLSLGIIHVHTYLVAAYLGLEAAGILRAMFNPVMPVALTITAISVFALPILSHDYSQGDIKGLLSKGFSFTGMMIGLACTCELLFLIIPDNIERLLYGGIFADHVYLIPALGFIPVFLSFGFGCSLILRALQKPEHVLIVGAGTAPVGLLSAFIFIPRWGLSGAAASMVLTCATSVAITLYLYIRWVHKKSAWQKI
jgi:O-antigen/teichoic acid export membrane protein